MIGDVELLWIGAHHFGALIKVNTDHQRLVVLMQAREQFSFYLESRRAVRGALFRARQSLGDLAHGLESDWFDFGAGFRGFHLWFSVARFGVCRKKAVQRFRKKFLARIFVLTSFSVASNDFGILVFSDFGFSRQTPSRASILSGAASRGGALRAYPGLLYFTLSA